MPFFASKFSRKVKAKDFYYIRLIIDTTFPESGFLSSALKGFLSELDNSFNKLDNVSVIIMESAMNC
ncbi:MAG: hypothetical protein A3F42_01885 [Gammaproteobacteria bacterium RIFCSPHIGHO2_12_FULL_37_34]|nr:MAG: hypothetical protein A3F42_01885 [Gammaproteobacteria bacterium RIFCSPHIGHO2_12_FULL_37_34]